MESHPIRSRRAKSQPECCYYALSTTPPPLVVYITHLEAQYLVVARAEDETWVEEVRQWIEGLVGQPVFPWYLTLGELREMLHHESAERAKAMVISPGWKEEAMVVGVQIGHHRMKP